MNAGILRELGTVTHEIGQFTERDSYSASVGHLIGPSKQAY